ncbi:unnamed protein product [Albugo candida]|uniref:ADP-ribosylation factor-like protein 2-binding protein n=1 Tax=Albugo candida TaxID=65357 RepID=A0A024GI62_9STRA|nr:unnamed protein product [Albugo candida]|eukprot:CCI46435.1 unnamed protein product [Albugo candida]
MSSFTENASFEPEIAESIEDEIFSANVGLENDKITKFDAIIGCLQDLLIDSQFVGLQQDFCLNHCEIFENKCENKLIYSQIFQQYTDLIENFIQCRLAERIEGFSMNELTMQLEEHEDEITDDIVDMLLSFSDFEEFKNLMLSYKQNEIPSFEIQGGALLSGVPT